MLRAPGAPGGSGETLARSGSKLCFPNAPPQRWRTHPTFHVSELEPFIAGSRPAPEFEKVLREASDLEAREEYDVEATVRSNVRGHSYKIPPLPPLLSPSTSRFFLIPALGEPTIASALACSNKNLIFLGVVVEKGRGCVRGFFHVGLRRPQP